jgi:hypothetical protein
MKSMVREDWCWLLPRRPGRNYASGTRDTRLPVARPSSTDIQVKYNKNMSKVEVKQFFTMQERLITACIM